jgi:ATP synthase protein I
LNNSSTRGELVRGWSSSGDLLASVITGILLGLGLDYLFGTTPVFVVIFSVAAAVGGFYKMRADSEETIDRHAAEAIRIRDGL